MTAQQTTNTADLIEQANAGNAQAQFELALRYLSKEFEAPELKPSLDWLIKSANAQAPKAQFTLALIYMLNKHEQIAKIFLRHWVYEIVEWSKNPAHNFSKEKLFVYSVLRIKLDQQYSGLNRSPDLDEETIPKARQKTLDFIQYCLGGFDISLNDQLAIDWLKQSSANHHPEAQFWLETCYPELDKEISTEDGILMRLYQAYSVGKPGFPKHEGIANDCLREVGSSENDDLAGEANYILACQRFETEHVKSGISFLKDAIQCGHCGAIKLLENAFLKFTFSEFYDRDDADSCYEFAYKWLSERLKDDPTSIELNFALGVLLAFGQGTERNEKRALECFQGIYDESSLDSLDGPNALECFADVYIKTFGNVKGELHIADGIPVFFNKKNNLSSGKNKHVVLPSLVEDFYLEQRDIISLEIFFKKSRCLIRFEQDSIKERHDLKMKVVRMEEEKFKAIQEKEREMLSFFTHTMRNALATAPEALRQAIQLLGSEVYEQDSNHYKAINKMTALFSSLSLTDSLIDTFKQSITDPREFKKAWDSDNTGEATPKWVVAASLRQGLNRILFMSDTTQLRVLLDTQEVAVIKASRKSFIDNVLPLNLDESSENAFLAWVEQHTPRIEVKIDETDDVHFGASQTRFSLLFAITSELILNALKYWDGQGSIRINWQCTESGDYAFSVTNHCQPAASSRLAGTHKGLAFIKRLIELLGTESQFDCQVNDQVFTANLILNRSLLRGES